MTYFLSPIGTSCHFPRRRKQNLSLRAERSRLDSPSPFRRAYARHLPRFIGGVYSREGEGLRSIFSVLFQGDCRGTSCLAMTTSRAMVRWDISLTLNMTESPLSSALPTLPPKEEARKVFGNSFPKEEAWLVIRNPRKSKKSIKKRKTAGVFLFFLSFILIYYSVLSVLLLPKNVPQPLVLGRG